MYPIWKIGIVTTEKRSLQIKVEQYFYALHTVIHYGPYFQCGITLSTLNPGISLT